MNIFCEAEHRDSNLEQSVDSTVSLDSLLFSKLKGSFVRGCVTSAVVPTLAPPPRPRHADVLHDLFACSF
jgi:hypothetical protein